MLESSRFYRASYKIQISKKSQRNETYSQNKYLKWKENKRCDIINNLSRNIQQC